MSLCFVAAVTTTGINVPHPTATVTQIFHVS